MTAQESSKKDQRFHRKDTFKAHQEAKVKGREKSVQENLELLGRSGFEFDSIKQLARHVCEMLVKQGVPCDVSTLVRRHHTSKRLKVPNPYRLLLDKYMVGRYFGKGKNQAITAEDVMQIRKKFPAVDAYCALKEGEAKNLQEQVKLLADEVGRLKGGNALPQGTVTVATTDRLDKTLTALKRLLDATNDFLKIDWQRRAIVDISHRNPKVVVEPELLGAFLSALEKSGIKPPEGK